MNASELVDWVKNRAAELAAGGIPDGLYGPGELEALKASVKDNVTLPSHYARFAIEPIRFCVENKLDAFQTNIIKYVCRHDGKNGVEDINKAIRYLEMYREYLKGNPNWWTKDFKPQAQADSIPKGTVRPVCGYPDCPGVSCKFPYCQAGGKVPHK